MQTVNLKAVWLFKKIICVLPIKVCLNNSLLSVYICQVKSVLFTLIIESFSEHIWTLLVLLTCNIGDIAIKAQLTLNFSGQQCASNMENCYNVVRWICFLRHSNMPLIRNLRLSLSLPWNDACEKRWKMGFISASLPPHRWFSVLGRKRSCVCSFSQCRSTMSSGGVKFYFAKLSPVNCGEFGQSWSRVSESGPIMSACLCQIVYTWLHMCVCGDVEGG